MARVFSLQLRALQGFRDSLIKLANIQFVCPHYSYISLRAKKVVVSFRAKGAVQHLVIDTTNLKIHSGA